MQTTGEFCSLPTDEFCSPLHCPGANLNVFAPWNTVLKLGISCQKDLFLWNVRILCLFLLLWLIFVVGLGLRHFDSGLVEQRDMRAQLTSANSSSREVSQTVLAVYCEAGGHSLWLTKLCAYL